MRQTRCGSQQAFLVGQLSADGEKPSLLHTSMFLVMNGGVSKTRTRRSRVKPSKSKVLLLGAHANTGAGMRVHSSGE